ncbi:MAG: sulfatase-like hydrolase/transferase, partial [Planctomycetota bacterium]
LGYLTGAFGKLHNWPIDDLRGFTFDKRMEMRLPGADDYSQWLRTKYDTSHSWWSNENYRWTLEPEDHYEFWSTSQAVDFIKANAGDTAAKPLFAWLQFQSPHEPFDPPTSVAGMVDADKLPPVVQFDPGTFDHPVVEARSARVPPEWKDREHSTKRRVAYGEMIAFLDQQIGRVLDALDEAGIHDDTTIIVLSDHGDMLGDYSTEAKGPFPYRQCLEIPLVLANHPGLTPGSRNTDLVGTIDIAGTVLDIAGDTQPIGMSRSLLGPTANADLPERDINFSEFNDSIKVVESREFRCCYYPFTNDVFLYRPADDPDLTRNLADDPDHAGTVRAMLQHIIDFQLIAKGVGMEVHDFVWPQQHGLAAKDPHYVDRFTVIFPLSAEEWQRTKAAGVDASFNVPFHGSDVISPYWPPYWHVIDQNGEPRAG